MPRATAATVEEEILHERWFIVQCLARNKDYLALYGEYRKAVERWVAARNARPQPVPVYVYTVLLTHWIKEEPRKAPPPSILIKALMRSQPHPLNKRAATALLKRARTESVARRKVRRLFWHLPDPPPDLCNNPTPQERELTQELGRRQHHIRARFGLVHPWDPRPYKGKSPQELGRLDGTIFDSIRLLKEIEGQPMEAETGTIDFGFASQTSHESRSYEDSEFKTFCAHGVDLFLALDLRYPTRRLRHDFERILAKIDRLRRAGYIKNRPPRPARKWWTTYLRVWDLREQGMTNAQVARKVLLPLNNRKPASARKRADDYYRQARYWISLDWARHPYGMTRTGDVL